MSKPIQWLSDLNDAKKKAQEEHKYVLLDFFNPLWMGCQQMDAVSYPNAKVIDFFSKFLAPVRVLISSTPLPQQFKVKWTPTFVILDSQGEEHHRSVGFLPPEELIPSLTLGMAKTWFDHEQFSEALSHLDRLISEYPKSDVSPEAIYYRGVSRYKATNDAGALKEAYQKLHAEYKDSEWAKRASVYRLLWTLVIGRRIKATNKIGILGDGNVGSALARGLSRAGNNDTRTWSPTSSKGETHEIASAIENR